MAAVARNLQKNVEPFKTASFSLQGIPSLERDERDKRLSIIKFNHKPSQSSSRRSTIVTSSPDLPESLELIIRDDDDRKISRCKYSGKKAASGKDGSYVLMVIGDEQKMTLEPVESEYGFNLRCAPWQVDEDIMVRDYPQIDIAGDETPTAHQSDPQSEEEELFGEELPEPDPENKFDYRHFLSNFLKSPQSSPAVQASAPRALERLKDLKPHKPVSPAASSLSTSTVTKTKPSVRKPLPKVRVQRRASVKQPSPEHSDVDDGGLTVEFDTDSRPRKKQFLGTPLSGRPVSLRSIANSNSPASFAASPLSQVNASEREEDNDIDSDEEDNQADEDIEMMQLPSPAAAVPAALEHSDSVDVNDDALEAELALALEQADDNDGDDEDAMPAESAIPTSQNRAQESDSESEEE